MRGLLLGSGVLLLAAAALLLRSADEPAVADLLSPSTVTAQDDVVRRVPTLRLRAPTLRSRAPAAAAGTQAERATSEHPPARRRLVAVPPRRADVEVEVVPFCGDLALGGFEGSRVQMRYRDAQGAAHTTAVARYDDWRCVVYLPADHRPPHEIRIARHGVLDRAPWRPVEIEKLSVTYWAFVEITGWYSVRGRVEIPLDVKHLSVGLHVRSETQRAGPVELLVDDDGTFMYSTDVPETVVLHAETARWAPPRIVGPSVRAYTGESVRVLLERPGMHETIVARVLADDRSDHHGGTISMITRGDAGWSIREGTATGYRGHWWRRPAEPHAAYWFVVRPGWRAGPRAALYGPFAGHETSLTFHLQRPRTLRGRVDLGGASPEGASWTHAAVHAHIVIDPTDRDAPTPWADAARFDADGHFAFAHLADDRYRLLLDERFLRASGLEDADPDRSPVRVGWGEVHIATTLR